MKKVLMILCMLAMMIGLVGCGKEETDTFTYDNLTLQLPKELEFTESSDTQGFEFLLSSEKYLVFGTIDSRDELEAYGIDRNISLADYTTLLVNTSGYSGASSEVKDGYSIVKYSAGNYYYVVGLIEFTDGFWVVNVATTADNTAASSTMEKWISTAKVK